MNSPRLKHPQVEEFVYQVTTSLHCQHRYRTLLVVRSQQERRLHVRVGGCSKRRIFFSNRLPGGSLPILFKSFMNGFLMIDDIGDDFLMGFMNVFF